MTTRLAPWEMLEQWTTSPPKPMPLQRTLVTVQLMTYRDEPGKPIIDDRRVLTLDYVGDWCWFGHQTLTFDNQDYLVGAVVDAFLGEHRVAFIDIDPPGTTMFFFETRVTNLSAESYTADLSIPDDFFCTLRRGPLELLEHPLYREEVFDLKAEAEKFNAAGSKLLESVKGIIRNTMSSLTTNHHNLEKPNPHRPEVRNSGMPRKRGKGRY